MTAFGAALEHLLQDRSLSQAELARRVEANPGQISRYISENVLPDDDVLIRICLALGDDANELLAAYLADRTPLQLRDRVVVLPVKSAKTLLKHPPSKTPAIDRAPARTLRLLEDAARECERRPEVVRALETILAITRP